MIDVRFLNHSCHRVLDRPVRKLIICMLIPNRLQVKVRAVHFLLEEGEISSMRDGLGVVVERFLERGSKFRRSDVGIVVLLHFV